MRIIALRTLKEFWEVHPNSEDSIMNWYEIAKNANWLKPSDVTDSITGSRYIGNSRFIFNIKGNEYRLIVKIIFEIKTIYVTFIGTHAEYDKIDPKTVFLY